MYTLRILNIIRLHHISSDHTDTTPLCLVSIPFNIIIIIIIIIIILIIVNVVKAAWCHGATECWSQESPVVSREERERERRPVLFVLTDCGGVWRPTN